ncbi:MAG: NUDIX domain-containing protein [Patescibacteria group bacterium]|nr:NUDIX domain-containing protein [Patescibacteria group bacterium]
MELQRLINEGKIRWLELTTKPRPDDYTVSVRVTLLNFERTKARMVLEKGDETPNGKPRGRGLPGGKVKLGETPFAAAWRELREEANILKEETSFDIGELPVLVRSLPAENKNNKEKRLHFEIYFFGQITDPFVQLPEVMKTQDVVSKVIEARWININDLPSVNEARNPDFKFLGEKIFSSHLDMIYLSMNENVEDLNESGKKIADHLRIKIPAQD